MMSKPLYRPLFSFLRYVQTTWYYNLQPKFKLAYFPDYDLLDADHKELINWDAQYSQRDISKLDAAYQAWNRGIILSDQSKSLLWESFHPNRRDNYRFIRKYFHPLWSTYVLCLRILSFNNPVAEIKAFWSQRKCKRLDLHSKVVEHDSALFRFESHLLKQQPKVAVIIPTLNRYTWLADALKDLEKQDYKNFEVIVVDQSEPFQADFYSQFKLDVKVIRQEEKALWKARNTAILSTDAEFLLLYDDDSRTEKDWISAHLKCLDYFQADISSGVSLSVVGAKVPLNYAFYRWSDQLDTGNAMVRRDVFRKIGLFDLQFEKQRMGDGEFGLRAYLHGFKNISNPLAKRIHLKVGEGGLRQMGSWDGWRPKKWPAPIPVPSVLYLIRSYFGKQSALQSVLKNAPLSVIPYQHKGNPLIHLIYLPMIIFKSPMVLWQVWKSWKISSKMIAQGPKIDSLS